MDQYTSVDDIPGLMVRECTPERGSSSNRENRIQAELVWSFGKSKQSFKPNLSFGYSSLRVKTDGDVNAVDIGVRLGLSEQGSV